MVNSNIFGRPTRRSLLLDNQSDNSSTNSLETPVRNRNVSSSTPTQLIRQDNANTPPGASPAFGVRQQHIQQAIYIGTEDIGTPASIYADTRPLEDTPIVFGVPLATQVNTTPNFHITGEQISNTQHDDISVIEHNRCNPNACVIL